MAVWSPSRNTPRRPTFSSKRPMDANRSASCSSRELVVRASRQFRPSYKGRMAMPTVVPSRYWLWHPVYALSSHAVGRRRC
eukprot:175991-Pyramimonas_sp.AAC.1